MSSTSVRNKYLITAHGQSIEVEGRDSVEAWARACDQLAFIGWKAEPARGKANGLPIGSEAREAARAARDAQRAKLETR